MATNWTTEDTESLVDNYTVLDNVYFAVDGTFSALGILFNTSTIFIILKGRRFGQQIKLQLLNISLIDLICSVILPTTVTLNGFTTISYPNNESLCKAQEYVTFTLFYASLLAKTAIAIEKVVAVCFPLVILKYERTHIISVIALVWVSAILIHVNIAIDSVVLESKYFNDTLVCVPNANLIYAQYLAYQQLAIEYAIKYLTPSFIILISYGVIWIKLWRRATIDGKTFNRKLPSHQVSDCAFPIQYYMYKPTTHCSYNIILHVYTYYIL